jgi:hypothetical protein
MSHSHDFGLHVIVLFVSNVLLVSRSVRALPLNFPVSPSFVLFVSPQHTPFFFSPFTFPWRMQLMGVVIGKCRS